MNGPADHAGDVLNCMLANGFTLVSFLSTILTSMCFSDKLQEIHFHILSPEENSGSATIVKNWILTTCHDLQHTLELARLIPTAPDPMMSHKRRRITTNTQSGNREWDVNTGVHMSMHQPI